MQTYHDVLLTYQKDILNRINFNMSLLAFDLPLETSDSNVWSNSSSLLLQSTESIDYYCSLGSFSFTPVFGATHILYENCTDELPLPFMIKVFEDTFSIYTLEGWKECSQPLSSLTSNYSVETCINP